ncbi:uncharacterized protein LOC144644829 isoform X3 [Oculina patagonica]
MASELLRLAFISLLPQALTLDCGGCHSTKSWADCESKLSQLSAVMIHPAFSVRHVK